MIKTLFMAGFCLLLLNACEKDEPEVWTSKIDYNGESAQLTFCFAKEFWRMEPQQGYNFDLFLFSPGLSVNDSTNLLSGMGSHFFAEFYCENDILEGTFNYNESKAENTFSNTELYVNYNFDTQTGTKTYIKEGTAVVSSVNDEITLTLEGKTSENKDVSIVYSGKIIIE